LQLPEPFKRLGVSNCKQKARPFFLTGLLHLIAYNLAKLFVPRPHNCIVIYQAK